MRTIYLFMAIGYFTFFQFARTATPDITKALMVGLPGLPFGLAVGYCTAMALGYFVPRIRKVKAQRKLVAMTGVNGSEGVFLAGRRFSNLYERYDYLYENADGSVSPGSVFVEGMIRIIQDSNLSNTGEVRWIVLAADKKSRLYSWACFDSREEKDWCREFHLPYGSVRETLPEA